MYHATVYSSKQCFCVTSGPEASYLFLCTLCDDVRIRWDSSIRKVEARASQRVGDPEEWGRDGQMRTSEKESIFNAASRVYPIYGGPTKTDVQETWIIKICGWLPWSSWSSVLSKCEPAVGISDWHLARFLCQTPTFLPVALGRRLWHEGTRIAPEAFGETGGLGWDFDGCTPHLIPLCPSRRWVLDTLRF